MLHRLTPLVRALPFAALLLTTAATDDCTITVDDDDDGEGCPNVEDTCQLDCELAVDPNGCALCECAPPADESCADDGDCGEGQTCDVASGSCIDGTNPCLAALCGPGTVCENQGGEAVCVPLTGCQDDGDCDADQYCDLSTCDAAGGGEGDRVAPCEFGTCTDFDVVGCDATLCQEGTTCVETPDGAICVPNDSFECESDGDCADGQYCALVTCFAPPDEGAPDQAPPCPSTGICVDTGECTDDSDCGDGGVCETVCAPIAPGDGNEAPCTSYCSYPDPPPGECSVDADCGPNQACEIVCGTDPSCPECDVCFFTGICVDVGPVCDIECPPNSFCAFDDTGTATCVEVPVGECTSDADCAEGEACNAGEVCLPDPACFGGDGLVACDAVCWGTCEPSVTTCFSDSDCADGDFCLVPQCAPCLPDSPGCGPCPSEGICVD